MNRNQRRLGRMHQKRSNDNKRVRQERLDRQEKAELQDRDEMQLTVENQEICSRNDRAGNRRERDENRHERAENNYDRTEKRHERYGSRYERNESRLNRAERREKEEARGQSVTEVEEVMSPKVKRNPKLDRFTTNKCCYVAPKQEDFGQLTDTEIGEDRTDKYQNILKEQYGFDPLVPETINQLKELRKLLCDNPHKVENSSQYTSDKKVSVPDFPELDGSQWQNIDNADEIDKYLGKSKADKFDSCPMYLPENIHICDIPRIKIIAKKFSRFKKNNVELRKLDEKVVCVEYDVFLGDADKPGEKLRAFFSIKPTYGKDHDYVQTNQIPSKVRNTFNISDDDLKKLNEKEIEIIDGKITENKTYLEDLKRILRRKQAIHAKKNKNSLDLMSLYEMAKRESPPLDDQFSNVNFLSKAELQEMKDLILRKCASSVQGVSRRTVKKDPPEGIDIGVISQSIMTELLRESTVNE